MGLPNSQLFASKRLSASAEIRGRKNGRNMIYAFARMMLGKNLIVPSVGPISLGRKRSEASSKIIPCPN